MLGNKHLGELHNRFRAYPNGEQQQLYVRPINMQEEEKPDRSTRNKNILVAVTIFTLVSFNLLQLYIQDRDEEDQEQRLIDKQKELIGTYHKLDSISLELESRINTIRKLGGKVDSLIYIRNRVEQEKYALRLAKDLAANRYEDIVSRLDDYENILQEKEKEIYRLQHNYNMLVQKTGVLTDSLNELKGENSQLSDLMQEAAKEVKVKGITLFSVRSDGRREAGNVFRDEQLKELLIDVNIAENQFADEGKRTLYISITGPNGQFLSNPQGETFRFKKEDIFYSIKDDFNFKPAQGASLELRYARRKSGFESGSYTLSIYCDSIFLGSEQFEVLANE